MCDADDHDPTVPLTNSQLLARYERSGDERAFAELVRRLSPMVLGICRRTLGDTAEAGDACQAAFIVLARKAAGIRDRESVDGWLFGVASRIARKARVARQRRLTRERRFLTMQMIDDVGSPKDRERRAEALRRLDEEIARLPADQRAAVVAVYCRETQQKQAAAELGISEATLRGRLARARKQLQQRLTTTHAAGLGGLLLALGRPESVSAAQVSRISLTALQHAAAPLPTGLAGALALKTLTAMTMKKTLTIALPALAALFLGGAAIYWGTTETRRETASAPALAPPPEDRPDLAAVAPLASPTPSPSAAESVTAGPPLSLDQYLEGIRRAYQLKDPEEQWRVLQELGIALTLEEWRQALADFAAGKLGGKGLEAFAYLPVVSWARVRPEEAMRWALANGFDEGPDPFVETIAAAWFEDDPEGVYQFIINEDGLRGSPLRKKAMDEMQARQEPLERGAEVLAIGDREQRVAALQRLGQGWPKDRLPEAVAFAQDRIADPQEQAEFLQFVNFDLARRNPQDALALLQRWQGSPQYGKLLPGILGGLMYCEPAEALRIFDETAPDLRRRAAYAIARHYAEADLDAAVNWLNTLQDPAEFDEAFGPIVDKLPADEQTHVIRQMLQGSPPDPQLREKLLSSASRLARLDPAKSRQVLDDILESAKIPPLARLISGQQPQPPEQKAATEAWEAVHRAALQAAESHEAQETLEWALQLTYATPQDRQALTIDIYKHWTQTFPQQAQTWAQTTPLLTEEEKVQLQAAAQ